MYVLFEGLSSVTSLSPKAASSAFSKCIPAFSRITVNTCLDLLHSAVLFFLQMDHAIQHTNHNSESRSACCFFVFYLARLFLQLAESNTRLNRIADKLVGGLSEDYPDVYKWCFRLLIFTQFVLLHQISLPNVPLPPIHSGKW